MRLIILVTAILLSIQITVIHAGRSFQDAIVEDHAYYTMSLYQDNAEGMYNKHFVDMVGSDVHSFLSSHSQAAEAIEPGFIFPFYGHLVHKFFVTTHGFLSFSPRLHNLMYKTQYIAPLRVKLDPSRSESSTINYLLSKDRLTIQWTNVTVAEPFEHPSGGNFTFQTTLHANGDIVFVYIHIPELLTVDALYDDEPVAGLSDAFLVGDSELHVYHTLNIDNTDIRTQTVVVFKAQPTCITQLSCEECAAMRLDSPFRCSWCPSVHRCSDGADRLREHWDQNDCGRVNMSTLEQCAAGVGNSVVRHTEWRTSSSDVAENAGATDATSTGLSTSTLCSIIFSALFVAILLALGCLFVYLYGRRNPGGLTERIAMRLEANYKRFGGPDEHGDRVELERKAEFNNNNNNSSASPFPGQGGPDRANPITVSF